MVKLICDRCGKECDGVYYTISAFAHDMKQAYVYNWCAAETAISEAKYSPIAELNRTPHYCSNCMDAFDNFLKGELDHA